MFLQMLTSILAVMRLDGTETQHNNTVTQSTLTDDTEHTATVTHSTLPQ